MKNIRSVILEVLQSIIPISLFMLILLVWLAKSNFAGIAEYLGGVIMAAVGMVLFLIGANLGLLPIGQDIGASLPTRRSLIYIAAIAFIIAFAVTLSEPNVLVLAVQAEGISGGSIKGNVLTYVIAAGSGILVAFALLRVVLKLSIRRVLAVGYSLVIILSFFTPARFVPLAFDAGGFSTGLMTIPVVMSLGVGFASVLSRKNDVSDAFGVVGLSCLGPIIGVMIMGIILL